MKTLRWVNIRHVDEKHNLRAEIRKIQTILKVLILIGMNLQAIRHEKVEWIGFSYFRPIYVKILMNLIYNHVRIFQSAVISKRDLNCP